MIILKITLYGVLLPTLLVDGFDSNLITLTLKVFIMTVHWDTFKQDNCSTVGGDGGCRVSEVQASTTSPMPDHKGFKLQ